MTRRVPSRRDVLASVLAAGGLTGAPVRAGATQGEAVLAIDDTVAGFEISPQVYGSNEIGGMDGGALSADLDRLAGVTARRLGGNLMTTHHWATNASNAGKDYHHANGLFLPDALRLDAEARARPAAVIDAMHGASLAMGASSLVTLPLAGFVAGDVGGEVGTAEAAPSRRFAPVVWDSAARATDPVDDRIADIPQLLRRLVARWGGAATPTGIRAYALDNEPDLWAETHPRIVRAPISIAALIERSIRAARVIKSIDPAAQVFGPASWGVTGMVDLQNAPDWPAHRRFGSFLGAYLDAFRKASEQDGRRLLDVLDVHWYPYSRRGDLFRTEDPALAAALFDAPRSLDEVGFREDSWVSRALPIEAGAGLSLPILPSLRRVIDQWFPGTGIAVGEFNFGGGGALASGLALADALGRFGANGVVFASHWGSLSGWLGEAYRLHREADETGGPFRGRSVPVAVSAGATVRAHAAQTAGRIGLLVINTGNEAVRFDVTFRSRRGLRPVGVIGFDAAHPAVVRIAEDGRLVDAGVRFEIPARAARRYAFV